jgi:predicted  nucleic acid-binding Zn-ribbon protein
MSFTLGGAVGPAGFYVERAADTAVWTSLSSFQSCYVAQPRQSGKSSLRKHTAARLRTKGFAVVEVDLTTGSQDPLKKFWVRIERAIAAELERLGHPITPWSQGDHDDLPERGFDAYLMADVLPVLEHGLVLFLDEVNVLGAREDSNAIFAELRALIERRGRCALCLLGVSRPSDLVSEPEVDPSPLMRAITIDDFTRQEAASFAPLLGAFHDPQRILDACFVHTAGHPYMLQNLLARAAESRTEDSAPDASDDDGSAATFIAALVEDRFFSPTSPDPVLEMPEHTFGRALDQRALDALNLYRGVIAGRRTPVENDQRQAAQEVLRLAGMVRFDASTIVPRNPIFARRYAAAWVRDKLDRPVYETMATRWRLDDHHPDFLLRGRALASATELLSAQDRPVSSQIADFIQASVQSSERGNPAVILLRRRLGYAIVGMVIIGGALVAMALLQRMSAQRAETQAARHALETKLEAAHTEKTSVEGLLATAKSETVAAGTAMATLKTKLAASDRSSAELKQEQDKLKIEYATAQRTQSRNTERIKAQLKDVDRRAATLADERSRLQGDLETARGREASLKADIAGLNSKVTALDAEVRKSKGVLDEEREQAADLDRQLSSLKVKIADVTAQLSDVQAKYGLCATQLSGANRELDATKSKVAACELKPQP